MYLAAEPIQMIRQEHQPLWSSIQGFSPDDKEAHITFSGKLAASQNWTISFAQKAIEEYKKFIFLCCISPNGAAPSKIVDEVWHLHLTYTQSYWTDLCKNILGRELHHYPSKGGNQEDLRHRQWYKETLQLYKSVFGADAPSDIWPPPAAQPVQPGQVLEDPPFRLNTQGISGIVTVLLLPFLFIAARYHTLSPFDLSGPHFLVFFPLYTASLIVSLIIYRLALRKEIGDMVEDYLPNNASVFQITDLLYGSHKALQASIVDLVERGLLEVPGYNQFLVNKASYRPDPRDKNPLMQAYEEAENGSILNYETLMATWYDNKKFSHPALDALTTFRRNPESFIRAYIFHFAFFAMVIARATQGIANRQPIIFLALETVGLTILLAVVARSFSKSSVVLNRIQKIYQQQLKSLDTPGDKLVSQFALQGNDAIQNLAQGAMLAGVFTAYTPVNYNASTGEYSSDSGGSGSSCSGGSSCGGGGCGGCSGS